ncbi:hypothetical protein [Streptomyces roseoverticillatus]|uniref:hypothetical protein n=1 Tax=Streptomyces roseoverticillatus TaxID=66429 RepID=UPI0004C142A1|nr:hypothetical protein [Streptomyces roseoverticillatus]
MTVNAQPTEELSSGTDMFLWGWNGGCIVSGFDKITDSSHTVGVKNYCTLTDSSRSMYGGPVYDSRNARLYRVDKARHPRGDMEYLAEYRLDRDTGALTWVGNMGNLGVAMGPISLGSGTHPAAYVPGSDTLYLMRGPWSDTPRALAYRAEKGSRAQVSPAEEKLEERGIAVDVSYEGGPSPKSHLYVATAKKLITFTMTRNSSSQGPDDGGTYLSYPIAYGTSVAVGPDPKRVFVAHSARGDYASNITRLTYGSQGEVASTRTFDVPGPWVGPSYENCPRFGFARNGGADYACYPLIMRDDNRKIGFLCFDTTTNSISRDNVIEVDVLKFLDSPTKGTTPVVLTRHLEPRLLCAAITWPNAGYQVLLGLDPAKREVHWDHFSINEMSAPGIVGGAWL